MQLFKKKKIVIDCITDNGFAFEFCRPDKAVKFIPNWWRELPGHSMNMKHCRGFTALYKNSFIYPSWTSFVLNMHSHKDRSFDWVCPDEFKIEPVSVSWTPFLEVDVIGRGFPSLAEHSEEPQAL